MQKHFIFLLLDDEYLEIIVQKVLLMKRVPTRIDFYCKCTLEKNVLILVNWSAIDMPNMAG